MKKTRILFILIAAMLLVGCGAGNANSLANNKYEFVSVSTKGDTLTAAQLNGIGGEHPKVSFTDNEMNLFYVAQYPAIEYTYVDNGKYKLTIETENGEKVEVGSLTEDAEKQIKIDFSIEGTAQTYVFKLAE